MTNTKRIFISVAEDSADLHAAALMRAARERLPDCRFFGLTGPRLRAAGAETVADLAAHAAMLTGVFSIARRAMNVIRDVEQTWRASPPDLAILLDSPELNLKLARRAKRLGIPVLYYIAPQTWASREYRNKQIAETVDRLACILPFEQEYFRRAGIEAEYVGHPLFETLRSVRADPAVVERLKQSVKTPLVALLPGSRRHVIDAVLPLQLDVIRRLRCGGVPARVAISAVSEQRAAQIRSHLDSFDQTAEIIIGDNPSLLSAADLVLVASGTATLEVAYHRKPMIVMYDAGPLIATLHRVVGRRFVNIPHLSLVNILAEARIVPEFMPHVPDVDAVARVAGQLLSDAVWRELMIRQLDETVRPLEDSRASENICRIIGEMLHTNREVECSRL